MPFHSNIPPSIGVKKVSIAETNHNLPASFFRKGIKVWIKNPHPSSESSYYEDFIDRSSKPVFVQMTIKEAGKDELILEDLKTNYRKRVKLKSVYPVNTKRRNSLTLDSNTSKEQEEQNAENEMINKSSDLTDVVYPNLPNILDIIMRMYWNKEKNYLFCGPVLQIGRAHV